MPPFFPVDIRDAVRPGQSSLPLGDHTEFGDLKLPTAECLLMVQVCLAPEQADHDRISRSCAARAGRQKKGTFLMSKGIFLRNFDNGPLGRLQKECNPTKLRAWTPLNRSLPSSARSGALKPTGRTRILKITTALRMLYEPAKTVFGSSSITCPVHFDCGG